MTRYRHSQADLGDVIVTHCTVDDGPGSLQTAITFRSGPEGCDLLVVRRPEPKATEALDDQSNFIKLA